MRDKPVNLNKARKTRARDESRRVADQNAIKFGRTSVAKDADRTQETKRQKLLDQHAREDP